VLKIEPEDVDVVLSGCAAFPGMCKVVRSMGSRSKDELAREDVEGACKSKGGRSLDDLSR
jgi:hypothetical protein